MCKTYVLGHLRSMSPHAFCQSSAKVMLHTAVLMSIKPIACLRVLLVETNCNSYEAFSLAGEQNTTRQPDNAVLQDRSEAMRGADFEDVTPPPEEPSLRQSYASTTSDQSARSADPLSSQGNIVSNGFEPLPQRLATILSGVSANDANTPSAAEIGDLNAQVHQLI